MNDLIKVFSDVDYSVKHHWLNHLIHPIRAYLGDGTSEWNKWEKDFLFYKDNFILTDNAEESDVGFLPMTLNYYIKYNQLYEVDKIADHLMSHGKYLFIWVEGDQSIRYEHPNCIFIKYFGKKSYKKKNEIIQPGDLKQDLLKIHFDGQLQIREKSNDPTIGFDGIARYPVYKIIISILKNSIAKIDYLLFNRMIKYDSVIPNSIKRRRYLDLLKKQDSIQTNFKLRSTFAPGTIGGSKIARRAFIDNIIGSDYTFCYRGAANYSLRFYETLCLGRIPLFIDTDCKLPFDDTIDWEGICLWVNQSDIDKIEEVIIDFHLKLTNSQFIERQVYCREIWEKYLSKQGFINNLNLLIKEKFIN